MEKLHYFLGETIASNLMRVNLQILKREAIPEAPIGLNLLHLTIILR